MRFYREGDLWLQFPAPTAEPVLSWVDLSSLSSIDEDRVFEASCEALNRAADPERGRVFGAALFVRRPPYARAIALSIHHLVIDNVSWRIVVEEMVGAHDQARTGLPIRFPTPAVSFVQFAHALARFAADRALSNEPAKSNESTAATGLLELPRDLAGGRNTIDTSESVSLRLESPLTRALMVRVTRNARARAEELLLAALAHALTGFTGQDSVLIDVESSGRDLETSDGFDLSRTVGWFTAIDPVFFAAPETRSLKHFVRLAKERLRAIPRRGPGGGLPQSGAGTGSPSTALQRPPGAEVSFLYLGQLTQNLPAGDWMGVRSASAGLSEGPTEERTHVLEARFRVLEESLEVACTFSRQLHRRATIEDLVSKVADSLRAMVDAYEHDPADPHVEFSEAGLTSAELASIERHLETGTTA
jgi:non-ribosomal peptide synthase protein (TIGR01720 family)